MELDASSIEHGQALSLNMKEDGSVAWSEKVDVYVVEVEMLFRMMLEDARERRLLLEAVDMLHRLFVWYVVCRFFRFPTDIFCSDYGCCEHI